MKDQRSKHILTISPCFTNVSFFPFHTRSLLSINVSPGLEGLPVPLFGRVEREEKFGWKGKFYRAFSFVCSIFGLYRQCLIRSGRRKYSPINVQKQILRASGSSIRPIGIFISFWSFGWVELQNEILTLLAVKNELCKMWISWVTLYCC